MKHLEEEEIENSEAGKQEGKKLVRYVEPLPQESQERKMQMKGIQTKEGI